MTYAIGTQFRTSGRNPRTCTVTDIHTTTNAAGETVKVRYVARHSFCGQEVLDDDVYAVTIAKGLVSTPAPRGWDSVEAGLEG